MRSRPVVGGEVDESAGNGAAGDVLRCSVGFENIATLITSALEFGPRLTGDKSAYKIKVMLMQCISGTHHYVSLCWNSEGDPSLRLVGGLPVTAN